MRPTEERESEKSGCKTGDSNFESWVPRGSGERLARAGSERIAVSQTPYSAVPGSPGVLERVAGATTDMQYIVHQGSPATRPRSG